MIDRRAEIQWGEAKDELGATGYEVKRLDAAGKEEWVKKVNNTHFADAAVTPGAVVTYQVVAFDAAGNKSEPARLQITIPTGPPQDEIVELEKPSAKHKDARTSWFLHNLYNNVWATYKGVELGRVKPFETMTLHYSVPDERAGAEIDVFLDATVVGDKAVEGTKLGTFVLAATGGWENMTPLTIPVKIDKPGPHDITIRVRRANSPLGDALGNLDKLSFAYQGG